MLKASHVIITMDAVFAKSITLLFLVIFLSGGGGTLSFPLEIRAIENEKQTLLSFKQGIINDTRNELSSWGTKEGDCCNWAGVACDNITGHVKELRLGRSTIVGPLKGEVNLVPALLNLTQLSHLDLSSFDSRWAPIPKFIGSLVSLRYLDLALTSATS